MKKQISTVITDLDNTLYDWFTMWYQSFSALLDQLVKMSGIRQETLESEIRSIFQRYHTSEYKFLIQELPSLKNRNPNTDLVELYQPAIQAYQNARETSLRLYPSVLSTLQTLIDKHCLVVTYTESMGYYTIPRIKKLHLDGLLDYLYSPKDHELPPDKNIACQSEEAQKLQHTLQRYTPKGEYKPNPTLLLDIINDVGAAIEQTIYIGDSLMKDVAMAQNASVIDVYAKYGATQNTKAYELLRRVSHWSEKDVQRERILLKENEIKPTYVLENSFDELSNLFEFIPYPDHK